MFKVFSILLVIFAFIAGVAAQKADPKQTSQPVADTKAAEIRANRGIFVDGHTTRRIP